MIDTLKNLNANQEYITLVWYTHIQCHYRYANLIWNENLLKREDIKKTQDQTLAKLMISYNGSYKKMLNLNLKTNTQLLLTM